MGKDGPVAPCRPGAGTPALGLQRHLFPAGSPRSDCGRAARHHGTQLRGHAARSGRLARTTSRGGLGAWAGTSGRCAGDWRRGRVAVASGATTAGTSSSPTPPSTLQEIEMRAARGFPPGSTVTGTEKRPASWAGGQPPRQPGQLGAKPRQPKKPARWKGWKKESSTSGRSWTSGYKLEPGKGAGLPQGRHQPFNPRARETRRVPGLRSGPDAGGRASERRQRTTALTESDRAAPGASTAGPRRR